MVLIDPALSALLVPLEDVHQHPDNPNNGDLDGLIESIRVNGFYSPIIVNADGEIIAGNHRYQAMLALGASHIPAIRVNADAEQSVRMMLVDNKITRNGWDDSAIVAQLLADLARTDGGLHGTGWSEDEMAQLAADFGNPLQFGRDSKVVLSVVCDHMDAARDLAAELIERGYEVDSPLT